MDVIGISEQSSWNEELTFSLKEPNGVLNLEVFDKDLLKTDDKMGQAQLSLRPLVSAARLRQILQNFNGETVLRKVVPDSDNCLVRESSITCVNGNVEKAPYFFSSCECFLLAHLESSFVP
ncbi:protein C2-DOMAIN ABA-RELATED 11-like isoform X1 [Humulus lupulus]|uniref:protein C2-DOMAIN ABA-RELATED 11-like isoform X1 n=1 Tax=Humulus lupulus TaxID=3486 RepID=UPI002B415FA1|nr:protein C2-DOMAIN ABA-RELATED 11-like isoform X1 [Humulus lupulus]